MSNQDEALSFAKDLVDPNFSLSVPTVAKNVIGKLLEIIEAAKPRTISTVEELEALPEWSVIIDQTGDICVNHPYGWLSAEEMELYKAKSIPLPAQLIPIPELKS